jgi:ribosomal-protein-alanine N-acetyltransferase
MPPRLPLDLFTKFPNRRVGEYVLRELERSDAPALLAYISDKEVHRFISDEDIPKDFEQALQEIEYWGGLFKHRQSIYWGIADRKTNELVGTCGYNYWNRLHRRAELSYDLKRELWGKGIMTEVLKEVVKFGFTQMMLHRVSATVSPDNPASGRVLEKLNFTQEGVMKDYKILHGKWDDAVMYALLEEEYTS